MKTAERRANWGCKNMEEPVSERESLTQLKNKQKKLLAWGVFLLKRGFSVHICRFGINIIGTGFLRI